MRSDNEMDTRTKPDEGIQRRRTSLELCKDPARLYWMDFTITISPSSVPGRTSAPPTQMWDWWSTVRRPVGKYLKGRTP